MTINLDMKIPGSKQDTQFLLNLYCSSCGKKHCISISKARYDAYIAGEFLDIAFSDVSINTRKMISSGMCLYCIKVKNKGN